MTRRSKHRLLLVTALLHLFADVAFAGGAVFCVGSNDHRAVELEHASTQGCQTAEVSGAIDGLAVASSAADCSDSPLHCAPELVGSADDGSDIAPTVVALASPPSSSDPEQVFGDYAQRVINPPGLRIHRTTILLL